VKWLIADQIIGAADLNFNPQNGPVEAPWLAWGPYLWADGVIPRAADGLTWIQSDLENDGTHPAPTGEQKVANMMSGFFGQDQTTLSWYAGQPGFALQAIDAIEDAHVALAQPAQNFGSSSQLSIAAGASASDVLIKFDVSAVTAPILFAKLSFRIGTNAVAPRALVRSVTTDSWTESTVTWGNAPAGSEPPVIMTGAISRDGSLSADVTSAVISAADGVLSLRLSAPSGSGAYLSRESGEPPRLILVIASTGPMIPASSTMTLIAFAFVIVAAAIGLLRRHERGSLPDQHQSH
jgi:hypothetical protein